MLGLGRSPVLGLGRRPVLGLGRSPVLGLGRRPVLGLGRRPVLGLGRRPVLGLGRRPVLGMYLLLVVLQSCLLGVGSCPPQCSCSEGKLELRLGKACVSIDVLVLHSTLLFLE